MCKTIKTGFGNYDSFVYSPETRQHSELQQLQSETLYQQVFQKNTSPLTW